MPTPARWIAGRTQDAACISVSAGHGKCQHCCRSPRPDPPVPRAERVPRCEPRPLAGALSVVAAPNPLRRPASPPARPGSCSSSSPAIDPERRGELNRTCGFSNRLHAACRHVSASTRACKHRRCTRPRRRMTALFVSDRSEVDFQGGEAEWCWSVRTKMGALVTARSSPRPSRRRGVASARLWWPSSIARCSPEHARSQSPPQ